VLYCVVDAIKQAQRKKGQRTQKLLLGLAEGWNVTRISLLIAPRPTRVSHGYKYLMLLMLWGEELRTVLGNGF
jgi:hypothetical protein